MITGVTIAWVTIGLFVVGLPLAAWWLGGRRFWNRTAGIDPLDAVRRTVMARHGLRPVDVPRVESAVTWGRALETDQLRAAAVDWAQQLIEAEQRRRAARPRLRAALLTVFALWATLFVGRLVVLLAQGRWDDVRWSTVVVYGVLLLVGWRLRTAPRRAIERNGGPAAT